MQNINNNIICESIDRKLLKKAILLCAERGDVLTWGKLLFPNKFTAPFCELHEYLISIMYDPFTVTLAPRGAAKTEIMCFLIPIFLALNSNVYSHFLLIQSTAEFAESRNNEIRSEFESNDMLIYCYGDMVTKNWTKTSFTLRNGVIFSGKSAEGAIRGISKNAKRPDFVMIDDLYREEDLYFKETRKKRTDWVDSALRPALASGKRVSMHTVGTAISMDDFYHTKKNFPGCKFKRFQSILDWENKEVLWKEYKSFEDLMLIKSSLSTAIFYREYQNEILNSEESLIKLDWLQFYDEIDENSERIVYKMLGVDPSIGEGNKSDYTGFAIVYKTIDDKEIERYYIVDAFQKRLTQGQRIAMVNELENQYHFDIVIVEGVSAFSDFVELLKQQTNANITKGTKGRKSKQEIMTTVSFKFENKKVYIKDSIDKTSRQELIDQLTINNPPHDDIRDAAFLCINEDYNNVKFSFFDYN